MSIRQGIGELEAWVATPDSHKISVTVPGAQAIGAYIDKESRNPFQHIPSVYWSISTPAIQGLIDNVKTSLVELISELAIVVREDQETPTADQATRALHVAISGGSPQINIAAPVTTVRATGGSVIEGVTGGQSGAAGHDLHQRATYTITHNEAVKAWLREFRSALSEIDGVLRPVVEQQLEHVEAEIAKPEPQEVVVNGLLASLRSFAQNAIASAGAGAGTMGLAEVVAHWPFH